MPEIRISMKEDLEKNIEEISKKLGLSKTEYIKGLISEDLRRRIK